MSEPGTRAEMAEVVAAQFFTYEQMREERDEWRGRAEVAEAERQAAKKAEIAVAGALGCLDAANDFEDPLPGSVQRARAILRAYLLGES